MSLAPDVAMCKLAKSWERLLRNIRTEKMQAGI